MIKSFIFLSFITILGTLPLSAEREDSWTLIWQDEFDKEGRPNPKKWTYEVGFIRNKEEQYYTKDKRKNARIEKGSLIIEAHREKLKNPDFKDKEHPNWQYHRPHSEYTSACLITKGLASWQYGKIEMRAKLPKGQGVWPAFWMLGINESKLGWPRCGEIDIMEYVHESPTTVYSTLHWPNTLTPKEKLHISKGGQLTSDSLQEWHIYSMIWNENEIEFLFDGQCIFKTELSIADRSVEQTKDNPTGNPFRQPFYLMINFAVGGTWGGTVDPHIFPQRLEVDYVRVYEKSDAIANIKEDKEPAKKENPSEVKKETTPQ